MPKVPFSSSSDIATRLQRIRRDQGDATSAAPTPEQAWAAVAEMVAEHAEHTWYQLGRCVYCRDCNRRLYQGTIPETHREVCSAPRRQADSGASARMRQRWGMD
jgi:hypothetical protein